MKRLLLVSGVVAILAVALLPYGRDAWRHYRIDRIEEDRQRFIELKKLEIACLERLGATGLKEGASIEAEIGRCRQLAIDPETGNYAEQPR